MKVDRFGQCYGTGMVGLNIQGDSVRTGECPVCGRRIGIANNEPSVRLTHHKPTKLSAHQPPDRGREYEARVRRLACRMNVAEWIAKERAEYADVKFGADTEAIHKLEIEMRDYGYSGEWEVFVTNYLTRVKLMGLDTPRGRQALGKAIVTLLRCLEMATEIHGPLPKPGVPSGEISGPES